MRPLFRSTPKSDSAADDLQGRLAVKSIYVGDLGDPTEWGDTSLDGRITIDQSIINGANCKSPQGMGALADTLVHEDMHARHKSKDWGIIYFLGNIPFFGGWDSAGDYWMTAEEQAAHNAGIAMRKKVEANLGKSGSSSMCCCGCCGGK